MFWLTDYSNIDETSHCNCVSIQFKHLIINLELYPVCQVREVVTREMAGPKEHLKFYDKYKELISKKVSLKRALFYFIPCLAEVYMFPL